MKDSKLKQILILLMMLSMGLFLISCGSSGGGGDDSPQLDLVSGVAATGAPMTGNVTLKDSNNTEIEPQAIGAGGSFSFDVTGLTPPFYIRAESITGEVLYSVSMESGTGNVNPLTNLAVAIAAGVPDPAMVYDDPNSYPITQAALDQAIADLLAMLEPLFDKYSCKGQNPLTDHFKANHLKLDKLFDDVAIDLENGHVTFIDKFSGSEICVMSIPDMDVTISVVGNGYAFIETFMTSVSLNVNELSLPNEMTVSYLTTYFKSSSITEVNVVNIDDIEIQGSGTCSDSEGSGGSSEACTVTVTLTDGTGDNLDVLDVVLLDANGDVIYSYFDVEITGDFAVTYLINN